MSSPDHGVGVGTDKVKVLRARLFDPDTPGQAMVDPQLAALEHVGPGGTLRVLGVPNDPETGTPDYARRVPFTFRVTAIVALDPQIVTMATAAARQHRPTAWSARSGRPARRAR